MTNASAKVTLSSNLSSESSEEDSNAHLLRHTNATNRIRSDRNSYNNMNEEPYARLSTNVSLWSSHTSVTVVRVSSNYRHPFASIESIVQRRQFVSRNRNSVRTVNRMLYETFDKYSSYAGSANAYREC